MLYFACRVYSYDHTIDVLSHWAHSGPALRGRYVCLNAKKGFHPNVSRSLLMMHMAPWPIMISPTVMMCMALHEESRKQKIRCQCQLGIKNTSWYFC